jgi:hypothetical protein
MLPTDYPSFGGQAMLDEKQPTSRLENAPHLVQCATVPVVWTGSGEE